MAHKPEFVPLEVPPGLRLAWEDRGRELPIRVVKGLPCTAMGEFPKAPPRPRKRKGGDAPTLFDGLGGKPPRPGPEPPAILVYAAAADADRAIALANQIRRMGYAADARTEPEPAAQEPKTRKRKAAS